MGHILEYGGRAFWDGIGLLYGMFREEDKGKKGVDLGNLRSNEHWKIDG